MKRTREQLAVMLDGRVEALLKSPKTSATGLALIAGAVVAIATHGIAAFQDKDFWLALLTGYGLLRSADAEVDHDTDTDAVGTTMGFPKPGSEK